LLASMTMAIDCGEKAGLSDIFSSKHKLRAYASPRGPRRLVPTRTTREGPSCGGVALANQR
jgi:hypothetical protein